MKLIIIQILILISIFLSACGREKINPVEQDPLVPISGTFDDDIAKAAEAYFLPSLSAAVVKNGQIVWEGYYGFADINSGIRPNRNTVYYVSSVSKLITALAVMQRVSDHSISIDSSVEKYLSFPFKHPNFPTNKLTVRHLLTHKSGLASPATSEAPEVYQYFQADSAPELFPWLREYLTPGGELYNSRMWKSIAPGNQLLYSNMGVTMLGLVVQNVSGRNFADYCKQDIFSKLDMNNSGFRHSDIADPADFATMYQNFNQPIAFYSVRIYPALSLSSSVADLTKFAAMILDGGLFRGRRILNESLINEMLDVKEPQYGLSYLWWSHLRTDGKRWYGHTGSFRGTSSAFFLNRESKVAIILLSNTANKSSIYPNGPIYNLVYSIASNYF